jgi:hypothetical protein
LGHCAAIDAQQKTMIEKVMKAVFFTAISHLVCFRTKIALRESFLEQSEQPGVSSFGFILVVLVRIECTPAVVRFVDFDFRGQLGIVVRLL